RGPGTAPDRLGPPPDSRPIDPGSARVHSGLAPDRPRIGARKRQIALLAKFVVKRSSGETEEPRTWSKSGTIATSRRLFFLANEGITAKLAPVRTAAAAGNSGSRRRPELALRVPPGRWT